MRRYLIFFSLLIIAGLTIGACGSSDTVSTPTPRIIIAASHTPFQATPPLEIQPSPVPPGYGSNIEIVATAVPESAEGAGDGEPERTARVNVRPVYIGFVLPDPSEDQLDALLELQDALNENLGDALYVAVGRYENQAEALAALCGNGQIPNDVIYDNDIDRDTLVEENPVVLAWISPFTYVAAGQEGCEIIPVLGIQQEIEIITPDDADDDQDDSEDSADEDDSDDGVRTTRNNFELVDGQSFDFLYRFNGRPNAAFNEMLRSTTNMRVCRLSQDDEISWIYPGLTIRAATLQSTDPTIDRSLIKTWDAIVEVEDYAAMVQAIHFVDDPTYDGPQCSFGAIPAGQADALRLEAQERMVEEELVDEDFEIPYDFEPTANGARQVRLMVLPEEYQITIPFDLFVTVPENVLSRSSQARLLEALNTVIEDEDDGQEALAELTDYDAFITFLEYELEDGLYTRQQFATEYYTAFAAWLNDANWSMNN